MGLNQKDIARRAIGIALRTPLSSALPDAGLDWWEDAGFARAGLAVDFKRSLYYSAGAAQVQAAVVDGVPAGEPTSAGMLVDGSDAPKLVQGSGPQLMPDAVNAALWTPRNANTALSTVLESLHVENEANEWAYGYRQIVTTNGATIKGSVDYEVIAGGSAVIIVGAAPGAATYYNSGFLPGASGTHEFEFVAGGSSATISVYQTDHVDGNSVRLSNLRFEQVLPYPGYDEDEQTIGIVWNANGVTGDRVVWEARKDANNRIALHFVSGVLRFESFVSGTSQGFVSVPGADDGGVHSAVLHINWVTGELSLDVDQQGLEGPELITNGGFGSATNWSLTGSAPAIEIADGVLKFNTSGANHQATQVIALDEGVTYRVRGDFVKVSGPHNLKVRLGGIDGEEVSAITTEAYDRIMVAGSSDEFRVRSNGDVVSTVDNASVVRCSTRTGVTLPTNLTEFHLGHSGGANQTNGYLCAVYATIGDKLSAWGS